MDVTISVRHCTISDALRATAAERIEQLTRYEPRLAAAEVVFDEDHGHCRVEARLYVDGAQTIIATGTAEAFGAAVDRAASRVARQLKRRRGRRRDHQARHASPELAVPAFGGG